MGPTEGGAENGVMTSGWDMTHDRTMEILFQQQNETAARLATVIEDQAADAKRSQRASRWFAFGSLAIAAGSLAVAIITLLLD